MSETAVVERWLPIPGYEGLYDVSDQGRVRSWRCPPRLRPKVLTPVMKRPRPSVNLQRFSVRGCYAQARLVDLDGRRVHRFIHRLVCQAFYGDPLPDQQVRHLNGISTDNRAENLRWGTSAENAADREAHGHTVRGELHGFSQLTDAKVRMIRDAAGRGVAWRTIAVVIGVDQRTVGRVVRGERWTHVA